MSTTFTPEQLAERKTLALHATYEVESIVMCMKDNLPKEQEYSYLRCMVKRIYDLNSIAMLELGGDTGQETEEVRRVAEGLA